MYLKDKEWRARHAAFREGIKEDARRSIRDRWKEFHDDLDRRPVSSAGTDWENMRWPRAKPRKRRGVRVPGFGSLRPIDEP